MDLRRVLESCFRTSLAAVDPRAVVAEAMRRRVLPERGQVVILALGKAAAGMAWGVADAVDRPLTGVVVSDQQVAVPDGLHLVVGGHPLPTQASLDGGAELLNAAAGTSPDDLVVCLGSGGGSALAEALVPEVRLDDLRTTTDLLLRSGASIDEVNAVRTKVSRLKGGGLAAAVAPATSITLLVSDVVGDRLDVIASGPMVAPMAAASAAAEVLVRYDLVDRVAPAVLAATRASPRPPVAAGDVEIVASRRLAAEAAAAAVRDHRLSAAVLDTELVGEAAPTARRVVAAAHAAQVRVYAGETTVTVHGDGRGGRNHEAALAAALELEGSQDRAFLGAGTDGIDGFTPGAGAVVDGATVNEARSRGLDPAGYLERNDSGGFFDRVPGRIVTGPTGTNVGDLWLVARLG